MKGEGKSKKVKFTLKEHLQREFTELEGIEEIEDLPKKWEKHGDLILLPQNCFNAAIWSNVDQDRLWEVVARYFNVSKVAKKGRICDDGKRTPQVILLKGDTPWVCHIDNKIRYNYDITRCMFSAGNITEKMRMANLPCEGEVIVDMFAGIGYFTLPLLVHAKAQHVHACEWNHNAVIALKKNLVDNKVDGRCIVYEGDNRKVCPENVADRVVMGLIPTALSSLEAACKALRIGQGGTLHIHQNVDSKTPRKDRKPTKEEGTYRATELCHEGQAYSNCQADEPRTEGGITKTVSCNKNHVLPEWTTLADSTAALVERTMLDVYKNRGCDVTVRTEVIHIEKVKSYAPHIDHMVLDVQVFVTIPPS